MHIEEFWKIGNMGNLVLGSMDCMQAWRLCLAQTCRGIIRHSEDGIFHQDSWIFEACSFRSLMERFGHAQLAQNDMTSLQPVVKMVLG